MEHDHVVGAASVFGKKGSHFAPKRKKPKRVLVTPPGAGFRSGEATLTNFCRGAKFLNG